MAYVVYNPGGTKKIGNLKNDEIGTGACEAEIEALRIMSVGVIARKDKSELYIHGACFWEERYAETIGLTVPGESEIVK